jgi:hypothetical protein
LISQSDFFEAGDFETLAAFDDADEFRGFHERFVRAGVEPGGATAELFDMERSGFEIAAVEVGDLEFATGGGLEIGRDLDSAVVVEIEAGNSEIRLGIFWFFLQGEDSTVGCEFDDAISAGLGDMVAEDGGTFLAAVGIFHGLGKILAVENVVAEDEGDVVVAEMTDPDWVPAMRKAAGIVTAKIPLAVRQAAPARTSDLELAVTVTPPGPSAGVPVLSGAGYVVSADRYISIGVRVAGRIDRYLVEEGSRVKTGDPLVQLRNAVAALGRLPGTCVAAVSSSGLHSRV